MGAEGRAVALKCRSEPNQTPVPTPHPHRSHMLLTCLGRGLIFHGSASAAGHLPSTLSQRPGRWSGPSGLRPREPEDCALVCGLRCCCPALVRTWRVLSSLLQSRVAVSVEVEAGDNNECGEGRWAVTFTQSPSVHLCCVQRLLCV